MNNGIEIKSIILIFAIFCGTAFSLEPAEILVIANSEIPASERIAQYYCQKRAVPADNLIILPLGTNPETVISRQDYHKNIAEPLRGILNSQKFAGKIKCLLTTYGVPIIVQGRGQLEGQDEQLKQFKEFLSQGNEILEKLNADNETDPTEKQKVETKIAQLQMLINMILGKETSASLDSELSMVLFENYELYRWHTNNLQANSGVVDSDEDLSALRHNTLMVSRLDGPGEEVVTGLIDKAVSAEQAGLKGFAYFDSRGIVDKNQYGQYDQSLRDLAILTKSRTDLAVEEERTAKLFAADSCPRTAVYCGWYSLKKYVDAFDFVDGAIGFHIASFEAVGLRDPNSSTWCPAMLKDGITATLGAVEEPYLHSFPKPKDFFTELYRQYCLVEAFYRTKPFNSWKLLLIGDPLYKPFKERDFLIQ